MTMQRRTLLFGAAALLAVTAGCTTPLGGGAPIDGHTTSGHCGLEAVRVKALGLE